MNKSTKVSVPLVVLGVTLLVLGSVAAFVGIRGNNIDFMWILVSSALCITGGALLLPQGAKFIGKYGSEPTHHVGPDAPPDHRG